MNAEEYFLNHSLDPKFVKNTLGWTWDQYTIRIPIYDQSGQLIYHKVRHLNYEERKVAGDKNASKFTFDPAGSHKSLYCTERIKEAEEIVLCEGEPDTARLWQDGIPAVTPTAGVGSFEAKKIDISPLLGKKIYVALDTDNAGHNAIEKDCNVLSSANIEIFIIDLPSEYKDICEFFASGKTANDFQELINKAISFEEWQENHESKNFAWETSQDILQDKMETEEWLVDRILPVDGFCFIAGAEATGKSFYALTLGLSIISGVAWLDKFKVNKQTNVLFIDKENSRRRIQKRLRGFNIPSDNNFKLWWVKYPQFFELVDKTEKYSEFALSISRKVKTNNIGLIIVDSLTDILLGNENAREDVQAFFDAFRQLFPKCSFLVLHHASKPAAGVNRTSSQKFRGSTNITAQIYSGFLVQATKDKGEFIIEQTKSGDAEKITRFKVGLTVEADPLIPDSTIVTKIDYLGEVLVDGSKLDEVKQLIIDMFGDNVIVSRKEIDNLCVANGVSPRTISTAVKLMVEAEELLEFTDPNDRRKKKYSLQEDGKAETN